MSSKPYKQKRFLCPRFLICPDVVKCGHKKPHVNDWRESCNGEGRMETRIPYHKWIKCPNCVELADE